MEIAEFNVRCYICWKKFVIPALSDFNYGEFLFVNYKTREFRHFNRFDKNGIEKIISEKLNSDQELQFKNDETKGNIYLKLVGKLSDGEFEPIFSNVKCPRCKCGFHSFPNNKIGMTNIAELTFEKSNEKTIEENLKNLII
ncbi:hypothetical protein [Corallibacter sp.]|uniref:hypothetical protein n=1 Tax=Corallibacter sp. TaxID=2038084 RepID=UPI003A90BEA3